MKYAARASALASMASVASAAPFHALSYEAGGGLPGIAGQGFSVDFGGFFVADGAGSNATPGSTGTFNAANEFEFDSHFALDYFGPSVRDRMAGPSNNSVLTLSFYGDYSVTGPSDYNEGENIPGYSLIVGPGSHIGDDAGDGNQPENQARAGIAVAPPPVMGTYFAPNATGGRSPHHGVFVGRFTIQEGATLSGGLRFHSLVGFGDFDTQDLVLGGEPVLFRTINGPQFLSLRAYRINRDGPVILQNPSAATADGVNDGDPFGRANVFDVWVQVPAPGVAWVAAPWLMMNSRRRP